MSEKANNEKPVSDHADPDLLNALDGEFVPGGGTPPPQQPKIETAAVLEGILGPAFATIAPNWRVSAMETKQLAIAYGGLIDKYFPDGLGEYGAEIAACVVTLAVFGPRLRVPPRAEEKPATTDARAE